ncbi:MAG: RDD family protein [Paracoccaceae bacterium]
MTTLDTNTHFPDPITHREFYADVTTKRLVAFFIDSILITAIALALATLTAFLALLFFGFLSMIVGLIYRSVSLSNSSATPGMRMMGIEFRTHQGEKLSSGMAIAHTILFTLSFSMVLPQVISIILILTTSKGQSLNDMLLGTAIINKSAMN